MSFRNEDDLPGSTQTYSVAVDPARGVGVATGLGLPWLSVIDLDTATRTDAIQYSDSGTRNPHVLFDKAGVAWVASASRPGLVRIDFAGSAATAIAGVGPVVWAVGLDAGVLVSGDGAVLRVDASGTTVTPFDVGPVGLAAAHPAGIVVVSNLSARLLDATTLAPLAACTLNFRPEMLAALDDGVLVYADRTRIGRQACTDLAEAETWTVGRELHGVAPGGDHVTVLDRVGADDPTRGVAFRVGAAGSPELAFATGKNTASGQYDADGVLWAASEGSSEVLAFGADGEVLAEVSTGTSLADLTIDSSGVLYGTGRLSALVGRHEGGALLRSDALVWPWAPRLDGERLVLLDHLHGELVALDAASLDVQARIDLGQGINELLTFDGLTTAPDRGTWLVAESEDDVVLEVDLDGEKVLRSWPLGGPSVTDPDQGAHLELHYLGDGEVFLSRTFDGRLTRLDLESGTVTHEWLSEADAALLLERRLTRALTPDGDRVWLGPHRINVDSLQVETTWDAIESLTAPWPGVPGDWAAISADGLALLHVDAEGEVLSRYPWFSDTQPGTVMVPNAEGTAFWVNRSYEGIACQVPLVDIDAERSGR